MKFIIGKKIAMSQMFDEKGNITPVTLIEAGPCVVLKKKTITKSMKGKEYRYIKEARGEDAANVGDQITVAVFKEGDTVTVAGISKGKGFQGGVEKHGFAGRNATHGAKHESRTIGSVGQRFPQHVIKGRKMPGRMGYDRTTVKNLKIAKIDAAHNVLAVRGAVPGHRGTVLE